jgi:uncharacterized Fe-S cluster-containing radical SAM superfamily protein
MATLTELMRNMGHFARNRIPGQLVIQFTNHCNARCPQCGMRTTARIARTRLDQAAIKRILDAAARQGIQAVSFTGGEPLLFLDDVLELIDYAGARGIPYIRTGTNGFLFRGAEQSDFGDRIKRLADRLAATPLRNFWISIDSAEPGVHESMRGLDGVINGIARALPLFHAAGLYPSANLGLNRRVGGALTADLRPDHYPDTHTYLEAFYHRFAQAFDRFYRFVHNLGFTIVNTCYPMSITHEDHCAGLSAVYAATAEDTVVSFAGPEKAMLYQALMDVIPRFRKKLRIFTPLSSLHSLCQHHRNATGASRAFGCRGGVDFFFIDAVGADTYPCGYRGNENLGKFEALDMAACNPREDCQRCDWECFRDPSEMCAPLLQILNAPLQLARRLKHDPLYGRLWLEDMHYYAACDYFDGRKPPR